MVSGEGKMAEIQVIVEGSPKVLDDRDYSGQELRDIGGLDARDKLVREEADGTETAIPATGKIRPRPNDNFFASVRHRRG